MPNWIAEMRPDWVATLSTALVERPDWVTALATAVLALFAAVQIGREVRRSSREAKLARIAARGPAWLARRNLEAILTEAISTNAINWMTRAKGVARSDLEDKMLEVARIGGQGGTASAMSAERALGAFVAYERSLAAYNAVWPSERDSFGGTAYSSADEERRDGYARDATKHLQAAIAALCELAPRQDDEPHPPTADQILTG
jgi:hypothetical protein